MVLEGLLVAAVAKAFYSVDKAEKLDDKALKKYAKAFERSEEAELLVKKKAEYTEKRLGNVVKKKRAIIQSTVPKFVKVYEQIQKIEIENKALVNEITMKNNIQKLGILNSMSISLKKDFSDKELICGCLTKGLFNMIEVESEKFLSAANSQVRASNVVYSQAESVVEIYNAICERADRISKLLMTMNLLFVKSIDEAEKVMNTNGLNVRNYSERDKGVLMTCVNIAGAISDIIDVPVINEQGQICESAIEMIKTGEQYLNQMKNMIV